jgi:hypothetical protein
MIREVTRVPEALMDTTSGSPISLEEFAVAAVGT